MKTIEAKDIASGQLVRVHQKIKEGNKTRTQVFEGTVIKRRGGNGPNASFTIRKKATGNVFVEKIYPIQLPTIEKVELVKEYRKRRAQMTFLRNPKFKKKLKEMTEAFIAKATTEGSHPRGGAEPLKKAEMKEETPQAKETKEEPKTKAETKTEAKEKSPKTAE